VRSKLIALLIPSIVIAQERSALELYGDVFQVLIPLYAFGLTLYKGDGEGTAMFLKSYGLTMGTTYLLKVTINAERPEGGGQSFPSGHASSAFAGAWFLQKRYGPLQGIPALLLAGLVGYSRVEAKKHWTVDVLGSAILSVGITFAITERWRINASKRDENLFLSIEKSW
jgi:membrane-associated phospholipid phosphatase